MRIDHLSVLRGEVALVSRLARSVPHDAPLPHLPGWTVHDLLAHLAGDYRWAQQIITTRVAPRTGLQPVAHTGSALCDEWDAVAGELLELLTFADPDSRCPNFAEGARGTMRFWPRHQAIETTVHRWDLEVPTGEHVRVAPDVAVDGIDEVFPVYAERYAPHDLQYPLTLGCPAQGRAWTVSPVGEGRVRVQRTDASHPADVEASPQALLLALWRRIGLDDPSLTVRADRDVVDRFFAGPLTA
jgi:uncharacterized protein (TIGR03083 family)